MSDGILDYLDFTDFEIFTNCIKGKQTNTRRFCANRATDVLKLIHTNICGTFLTVSRNDQQYFIIFIDDFSCYGYLYLIHEKSQSLEVFKSFKVEVENQLNKMIKTSDLTMVVNTMVSMTVQVNYVQDHLLNS